MTVERHALEKLLAGGDEASALALASLRSGATYSVGDRAQPAERHVGVFGRRLQRMRMHGVEPLGLERAVQLLREHSRPVRVGLIDSADRTWPPPALPHRGRQRTSGLRRLAAAAGWQGAPALGVRSATDATCRCPRGNDRGKVHTYAPVRRR